jgi:hypothetical protein
MPYNGGIDQRPWPGNTHFGAKCARCRAELRRWIRGEDAACFYAGRGKKAQRFIDAMLRLDDGSRRIAAGVCSNGALRSVLSHSAAWSFTHSLRMLGMSADGKFMRVSLSGPCVTKRIARLAAMHLMAPFSLRHCMNNTLIWQ